MHGRGWGGWMDLWWKEEPVAVDNWLGMKMDEMVEDEGEDGWNMRG